MQEKTHAEKLAEVYKNCPLSLEEQAVMRLISYKLLKVLEPNKAFHAMNAIHAIQQLFMHRACVVQWPGFWPNKAEEEYYKHAKLRVITPRPEFVEEYEKWLKFYEEYAKLPMVHPSHMDDIKIALNQIFELIS